MYFEIDVEAESVEQLLSRAALSVRTSSIMKLLAGPITLGLQTRARERFASEGDSASGDWDELKEATNRFREAGGFPPYHPINRRTGAMERYVTGALSLVLGDAGGATLTWPGDTPSADVERKLRTAQLGKAKPSTVPRPVIAANHTDLEMALVSTSLWIGRVIRTGVL